MILTWTIDFLLVIVNILLKYETKSHILKLLPKHKIVLEDDEFSRKIKERQAEPITNRPLKIPFKNKK